MNANWFLPLILFCCVATIRCSKKKNSSVLGTYELKDVRFQLENNKLKGFSDPLEKDYFDPDSEVILWKRKRRFKAPPPSPRKKKKGR